MKNRSFEFELKTSPTAEMIRKSIGAPKGSARPNTMKIGKITRKAVEDIAKVKLVDLNAYDLDAAKKMVEGTARSMGVEVID